MLVEPQVNISEPLADIKSAKGSSVSSVLFFAVVFVVLLWGWMRREDQVLTAESGLGYALGILGVSGMVLLLTYPLAKRSRKLQKLMAIRHWFRIHMMLGVLGPLAIAFHSNFRFGSLNSTVALNCMLLVVASGFVGRYIYTKIHMGLYGQRASGRELATLANYQRQQLTHQFERYPEISRIVDEVYHRLLPSDIDKLSVVDALLSSPRRLRLQYYLRKAIKKNNNFDVSQLWRDSKITLKSYTDTLRRLAQLRLFERLFSWWHVVHLPFFIMMMLTVVLHVWAVHYY